MYRLSLSHLPFNWCWILMWQLEIMRQKKTPASSVTHSSVTRAVCLSISVVQGHFTSLQLSLHAPGRARGDVMRASGERRSGARVIFTDTRARPSIRASLGRKCEDTTTRQHARGNNKLVWSDPRARGQSARVKRRGTNEHSRCLLVSPHLSCALCCHSGDQQGVPSSCNLPLI